MDKTSAAGAAAGAHFPSKTARELILRSEIRLWERGPHVLKGVPGRWHLVGVETTGEDLRPDEGHGMQQRIGVSAIRRRGAFVGGQR